MECRLKLAGGYLKVVWRSVLRVYAFLYWPYGVLLPQRPLLWLVDIRSGLLFSRCLGPCGTRDAMHNSKANRNK